MPAPIFLGPPPLPFAHQGGGREHTENSWEAFEHARSLGYPYLETDVQTSSDGVVFCMHDPTLDRTTNGHGKAAEQPWANKLTDTKKIKNNKHKIVDYMIITLTMGISFPCR